MKEKTHLVRNRCLFSIVIIVIYFLCHRIPLNGIDMSAYDNLGLDLGAVLSLAVNGSNKQCYVMSLGISPYITASLVISILFAMRSKEARARTSPKAMNYWITAVTFIVTLVQSIFYALNLKYVDRNVMSVLLAILELMAGASIAQYLLMKNQKYGVGGFAPIIIVNMTETLIGTLMKSTIDALMIPLGISFVMVVIMIFMEMHEKKIPLQRVSVHNVHADKNYLAIKYNPVGFMALMFGSAIFMIPQLIVALIHHYHKSEIINFLFKNLRYLNLYCTFSPDTTLYSSSVSTFLSSSFDSSGTTPYTASTKHNGGYNTHHQFLPEASPISILNASYSPGGNVISP